VRNQVQLGIDGLLARLAAGFYGYAHDVLLAGGRPWPPLTELRCLILPLAFATAAGDDEVQRLDRALVDAVEHGLRLAVEDRVGREAEDTGEQAEGRAVHGLRDALREHRRLHRRVDAGDAGERLDEARDGPEQAGERRQVAEHREVAGPLLELRQLAERLFVHRLLH